MSTHLYIFFLAFAVKSVGYSRRSSANTTRGFLAFVTKDYRDDTYYWCLLVFLKDFLLISSAAFFRTGVNQLMFRGVLSLLYTFLLGLVAPYELRSANNADQLTSFLLSMQTLLSAGSGLADAKDACEAGDDGGDVGEEIQYRSQLVFIVFGAGALATLLQIVHTILVGIPVVSSRLPHFLLPISPEERGILTEKLMDQLTAGKLRTWVGHMDAVEWYRFYTGLTEASSAEHVLSRGRLSFEGLMRSGTQWLEQVDDITAEDQEEPAKPVRDVAPTEEADAPAAAAASRPASVAVAPRGAPSRARSARRRRGWPRSPLAARARTRRRESPPRWDGCEARRTAEGL